MAHRGWPLRAHSGRRSGARRTLQRGARYRLECHERYLAEQHCIVCADVMCNVGQTPSFMQPSFAFPARIGPEHGTKHSNLYEEARLAFLVAPHGHTMVTFEFSRQSCTRTSVK